MKPVGQAHPTARRKTDADSAQAGEQNRFRREGDFWALEFDGNKALVRDLKGMRYLARLLADPAREFHALDLVAVEAESSGQPEKAEVDDLTRATLGDAGEMLDAQAKGAYRRRLAEVDEDIADARSMGDIGRVAQAEAEREFLTKELSRAVGLGGRDRRAASASERARAGVTRAIRQAMARIAEHHASLGVHLDRTIRTGTYCVYLPEAREAFRWHV
jgi:hypothetical protein